MLIFLIKLNEGLIFFLSRKALNYSFFLILLLFIFIYTCYIYQHLFLL